MYTQQLKGAEYTDKEIVEIISVINLVNSLKKSRTRQI
jgi:alkylhydroperoxidase family enzyme